MPILNIRITSNKQHIQLSGNIVSQNLTLQMASVQFTSTSGIPLAVNIKLPYLNRFQIHNSQRGNHHLTIPVDVEKKTTIIHPNLEFATENIYSGFTVELFREDGITPLTNFSELQLWFHYNQPSLY